MAMLEAHIHCDARCVYHSSLSLSGGQFQANLFWLVRSREQSSVMETSEGSP